jgi:hypothetical protein
MSDLLCVQIANDDASVGPEGENPEDDDWETDGEDAMDVCGYRPPLLRSSDLPRRRLMTCACHGLRPGGWYRADARHGTGGQ